MRIVRFIPLLFLLFTCQLEKSQEEYIVCSTSIIQDCVQRIVGPKVKVYSLMKVGVDPHTYSPKPSDIPLISKAKFIVINGFHLEGKMVDVFENVGKYKKVFYLSDYYPKTNVLSDETGVYDPHIWFNPEAWFVSLEVLSKELQRNYPKLDKEIDVNFSNFKLEMENRSQRWKEKINQIPKSKRVLITSHDAFQYFSKAFDIEVHALQGISTVKEANVSQLKNLVNLIRARQIPTVFIENSVNPKTVYALTAGASTTKSKVELGGELFSDALGENEAGTYLGMLDANINTLVKGWKTKK